MNAEESMEVSVLSSTPSKKTDSQAFLVPVNFDKESPKTKSKDKQEEECFGCIIGTESKPELETALKTLGMNVFYSPDGRKVPDYIPDECDMVFVCEEFEGPVFEYLQKRRFMVIAPPVAFSCVARGQPLPNLVRPLYNDIMKGLTMCYTGFHDHQEMHRLYKLAQYMGAGMRKRITTDVTHVVAKTVGGSNYKAAIVHETPIMSDEWIATCWERRREPGLSAVSPELSRFNQLPFKGCVIALHGFPDDEAQHITEIATSNGATVNVPGAIGGPPTTHLVVCDGVEPALIPPTSSRVQVVKQKWFWESIKIDACTDERLYQAKESVRRRSTRPRHSISLDSSCLLEASIFSLSSPKVSLGKRDHKGSPTASPMVATPGTSTGGPADTARKHIITELLQTEKNFVNILEIIVSVFKEPLERAPPRGGPILSNEDIKSIFANIPEILAVHKGLVTGLETELRDWTETSCIGQVLLEQSEGFLRVYPPFVNFFDMSKEALHKCDKNYPRFHAFLKSNESRAECTRQTLAELLITPVQRIPRIILLVQDLVKHTDLAHPDLSSLKGTVEKLKTVMTHINEDRRKTEGQVHMFEVLRDVEGCPATVLSAQRSFVRRVDAIDVSVPGKVNMKGEPLAIFLFSDSLEVAKRRNRTLRNSSQKAFKHIEFIQLSHVRSVIQFGDTGDFNVCFGLLVRWPEDPQDKLIVFKIVNEGVPFKNELVAELAKMVASIHCATDSSEFIMSSTPDILNSMMKCPMSSSKSFKKAFRGARKKVKRALSGRQTKSSNLSSVSCQNLHRESIGDDTITEDDENEVPMDTSTMTHIETLDTSIGSVASAAPMSCTPAAAAMRTPRPKRFALSQAGSFSSIDLRNIGTPV